MDLKIIIPAGGDGIRFKERGHKELKPFIKFLDKTMLEHLIVGFISKKYKVNIYIVIRKKFKLIYKEDISFLEKKYNFVKFIYIDKKTEGTTATALHLYDKINNSDMLLLANCDQIVDYNIDDFIDNSKKFDGSLLVFDKEKSNKWSYVELDDNKYIKKVVAKQPISDLAVCGWYFWRKSSDFIKYAIMQIITQDKVNNEYYLCPIYNFAIKDKKKIVPIIIKKSKMHGVGTPEDLKKYLDLCL